VADILAILLAVGGPFAFLILRTFWKEQNRRLELMQKGGDPLQLEAVKKDKLLLEARVQNLESIVTSVDYELNQRLSRLAAAAAEVRQLPAPQDTGMAATAPSTPSPEERARRVEYRLGLLTSGQVVLGRYTVERELGRGGMGAVYLARDATLGEKVALKVISSMYSGDPLEAVARFKREVTAARRVTHENVVRIHDLGEDGPLLFLSMEHVDGETLHDRVKRAPLGVADARELLVQVAAGVAAAHAAGVIHRDLKPQNVLIPRRGGPVKVIDFGLAKSDLHGTGTATGVIMGTPEYMSPEQVRGRPCDARADVYALGATAYFALTGRPPFEGDSPIAISFAQVNDPPVSPRTLRPEVPEALDAAILRALEKDPIRRFSDAAAFRAAIA
jgi:serine/threonine protein kinase